MIRNHAAEAGVVTQDHLSQPICPPLVPLYIFIQLHRTHFIEKLINLLQKSLKAKPGC